jgi:Utp25, U3 small nucleolar RNA-associated SSU processome protein 25
MAVRMSPLAQHASMHPHNDTHTTTHPPHTVLEALNRLPREQHGVDIMRVRPHLLAGWGGLYRQTIITASFATPTLHAAFGRLARSHAGGARLVTSLPGVLGQVVPQVHLYQTEEEGVGGWGDGRTHARTHACATLLPLWHLSRSPSNDQ